MSHHKLPHELWALIAASFCVSLGYGVVAPVIPQIAKSFGVSVTLASALISAFALMRIVGAPLASLFTSKFTERAAYMLGLTIVAVSTGLCAFVTNYQSMIVMRALGGIGSVMFSVAATSLLIKFAPVDMRGRVVSYNGAAFLLGNLCGPVLGAAVTHFGIRTPFVFYAATLIISVIVIGFTIKAQPAADASGANTAADEHVTIAQAFKNPSFKAAMSSLFATGWAIWGARISVVPLFVITVVDKSPAAAGWALAAFAAGNALLIIPSGRCNDRYGRKPMVLIGLAIIAGTYFTLPFIANIQVLCALMAACGMGASLANPAQQAIIADVAKGSRSTGVVSASQMAVDVGSMIAPIAVGLLADHYGYRPAFTVTGVILCVALVWWLFAPETLPKNKRNAGDDLNTSELIEPNHVTGAIPVVREYYIRKPRH
ncbi:MFS transporter [Canibacter sp. lx-45]|uniref:MFS transporter n=1 Tax=Canibacter zhuwentaonis TaxID=2837491 RepID=UPI001BDC2371|nr:MFS transporter [Canibacter zhuwentaonis]